MDRRRSVPIASWSYSVPCFYPVAPLPRVVMLVLILFELPNKATTPIGSHHPHGLQTFYSIKVRPSLSR
jgi:hypothetical protein